MLIKFFGHKNNNMKRFLTNWKTNLTGLGALVSSVALIFNGHLVEGITGALTAIGLFSAKDA
jgi:hypothetical protein